MIETIIAGVVGLIVCFGYNIFYFEATLPTGSTAQVLDILDYLSNNALMPIVAIATCILVGWVIKPKTIIDEVEKTGDAMSRKNLYKVMVKFVTPALLIILFLKSVGLLAM